MAAGKALGPLCGGGDRRLGFASDEGELPRLGFGVLPAVAAAGHPGLWLRAFSSRKLEGATYDSVGRGQKPRQSFICNRYRCSGRVADWLGSLGYSSFLKD